LTQGGTGVSTLSNVTVDSNTLSTSASTTAIRVWDDNVSTMPNLTVSNNDISGTGQGIRVSDIGQLDLVNNSLASALFMGGNLTSIARVNYSTGDTAGDSFTVNATEMWDNANAHIAYSGVTDLFVYTLGGDDNVTINQTDAILVTVDTGAGSDTLNYETGDLRDDVVSVVGGTNSNISNLPEGVITPVQHVVFANTEIRNVRTFGGNDIVSIAATAPGQPTLAFNIYGGDGADILTGGSGDDWLFGEAGNDRLDGRVGNDHLFGGSLVYNPAVADGDDALYGGLGNDYLNGGNGRNVLYGQNGNDVLVARYGTRDLLDGGAGYDKAWVDPTDLRSGIEELLATEPGL